MGWGQGARTRVILVVRACIWNGPVFSLALRAFDNTGSLGSLLRQVVHLPGSVVPPGVTASRFLTVNREAELKYTTFSSLLLFPVLLPFLLS